MSDESSAQYSFRLPFDLVERIEREVEREKKAHPGRSLTRADVVRELLHAGLDVRENEAVKVRKKKARG